MRLSPTGHCLFALRALRARPCSPVDLVTLSSDPTTPFSSRQVDANRSAGLQVSIYSHFRPTHTLPSRSQTWSRSPASSQVLTFEHPSFSSTITTSLHGPSSILIPNVPLIRPSFIIVPSVSRSSFLPVSASRLSIRCPRFVHLSPFVHPPAILRSSSVGRLEVFGVRDHSVRTRLSLYNHTRTPTITSFPASTHMSSKPSTPSTRRDATGKPC